MMKIAFAFAAAAIAGSMVGPVQAAEHDAPAHWSYSGKTDPRHWAEIDQLNSACKLSKEQSPIDIDAHHPHKATLAALKFDYVSGAADVVNNGHTVQVNLPEGSVLTAGDATSKLLQFHFHTPSEETFNGKPYPMEAHFVHKNASGGLSVVAVLFKEGKANATLAPVLSALPAEGSPVKLDSFNPAAVLPSTQTYYQYAGSLTTPPCSDGVHWQVLKTSVELSKQQIAAFRKLYPMNARPVQPLNGRIVQLSK